MFDKCLRAFTVVVLVNVVLASCASTAKQPSLQVAPTSVATNVVTVANRTSPASATQTRPTTETPSQPTNTMDPDVLAVVNGRTISKGDYEQQLIQARMMYIDQAGLDPNSEAATQLFAQLHQQVLDSMVDQILLQQAALADNIQITDSQVNDQIIQMKGQDSTKFEQWLQDNGLNEASLRQRLFSDLLAAAVRDVVTADLSQQQVHIHARYIFNTDLAKAQEALAKLQAGADFGEIARQYSMDETTRESGGDLGYIPHGVMPLAFDKAAFALRSDQISEIVSVDSGFMIIQVLEIDPARTVSDDNWPLVQQYYFETWLANQRAQAEIMYNPAFE